MEAPLARSRSYRRHAGRRRNPSAGGKGHVSPLVWGLGGLALAAAGYGIYRLTKKPSPVTDGTNNLPNTGGTNSPAPGSIDDVAGRLGTGFENARNSPPSSGGSTPSTLVSRLQNSADARKAFALQAGAYSWYLTDAPPDGLVGPATRSVIAQIDHASNTSGSSVDKALALLAGSIILLKGNGQMDLQKIPHRLIPMSLPQSLLDLINHEQAVATQSLGGRPPAIQARAS